METINSGKTEQKGQSEVEPDVYEEMVQQIGEIQTSFPVLSTKLKELEDEESRIQNLFKSKGWKETGMFGGFTSPEHDELVHGIYKTTIASDTSAEELRTKFPITRFFFAGLKKRINDLQEAEKQLQIRYKEYLEQHKELYENNETLGKIRRDKLGIMDKIEENQKKLKLLENSIEKEQPVELRAQWLFELFKKARNGDKASRENFNSIWLDIQRWSQFIMEKDEAEHLANEYKGFKVNDFKRVLSRFTHLVSRMEQKVLKETDVFALFLK